MQTKRRLVLAGTVVGTFLSSLDITVVGTAMPSIVARLGGLDVYPWVFSIYLLTSTTTMPLYGKAADLFGRKPIYLLAVSIFIGGSLLCASASTMTWLIVWRAVQGLGAGGVMPLTLTIVGDLYPAEQRAKVQGLFSVVWALSSVAGPPLGAFVVSRLRWEWIFLLNLPFGLVGATLVAFALHERVERVERAMDVAGAALVSVATASLMWALIEGGRSGVDARVVVAIVVAAALAAVLVRVERRQPQPLIPPSLLATRAVAVACGAGVFLGTILWGVTGYVPTFVQGAMLGDSRATSMAMIAIGIGWPLSSTLTGRAVRRLGYRGTVLLGAGFLVVAMVPLGLASPSMPLWQLVAAMLGFGTGMGFAITALMIAAQDAVAWSERGAATSLIMFSRTVGGAIGVAAMGAVLNATLRRHLGGDPALLDLAAAALDPERRAALDPAQIQSVAGALGAGLTRVLDGIALTGFAAALAITRFPKDHLEKRGPSAHPQAPTPEPSEADAASFTTSDTGDPA